MLTEVQVIELKLAHKQTREKRLADRIKAVLYLHYGLSYTEIAKLLLFDEVTIRRYLKQFKEKGISGLLEYRYTGGKSHLTLTQEEEVRQFFKEQTPTTSTQAGAYIQKTYGVTYSVIGVTKLMHRIGFVYKKPKLIPGKLDQVKQDEFVKQYAVTKEQLGIKDKLYFLDATHPTHNTKASYGWMLKGKKNDKYVKSTSGRKRLNLNGALNFNDKTAIVLEEETIDASATTRLLEAIAEKQKHGKAYVILDNAKQHHARLVRRWQLHHPRFKLIFLPPYSPNLNIIERLWRFYHQKITNNRYFETFKEFKTETLTFFENLKQHEEQLAILLTDNFQRFPIQKLQT